MVKTPSVPLAENAVYHINLIETNGTELINFLITTVPINPKNLASGEIEFVFRVKNHSVASARINVLMNL